MLDASADSLVSYVSSSEQLAAAARSTGAVCLTDIEPHAVTWLWPGRIPFGNVTLLVSDPGAGKSLIALDIAARITTAKPWPDRKRGAGSKEQGDESSIPNSPLSAPGSVLLINIEDHFHNTIRPRLDALGADCARIVAWTYVRSDSIVEGPRLFALDRDMGQLHVLINAMQDCRLVVIDPISAFLGTSGDQNNAKAWKLLSALASLARKHNFAVLAVSHFRKKEGAAIQRALGSLAFVAAARAVWTIARDPADTSRRLFLPLKNNLAECAEGIAFSIVTNDSTGVPVIRWLPDAVEYRADTILVPNRLVGRPDDERKYALQWLRARLSEGPSPVCEIRRDADAHGIGYGTLRRAFRELGATAMKQKSVPHGQWQWKLPVQGAQNSSGEFCAPCPITDEFAEPVQPGTPSHRIPTSDP